MASKESQQPMAEELEANIEFITYAKNEEYSAIDLDSLNYTRMHEEAEHINVNQKDYYCNFV